MLSLNSLPLSFLTFAVLESECRLVVPTTHYQSPPPCGHKLLGAEGLGQTELNSSLPSLTSDCYVPGGDSETGIRGRSVDTLKLVHLGSCRVSRQEGRLARPPAGVESSKPLVMTATPEDPHRGAWVEEGQF